MSAPVNQQISGLIVGEGGKLFAGYNNTTTNVYSGPPKLLPYFAKAAFNAFGKDEDLCLPNTRVNILDQIRAWINGFDGTNVFWLSGWAGTGKSIIARTISREYYDTGRQGENFFASFFFSRGEEDVSDAGKFVTSIAVQLAKFPVLKGWIHKAALDDDRIVNKILHDQWKQLVIEPLSKLDTKLVRKSLVLVIDALDECDKQGDIRRVLQLLANARALQTVRLRVLITSRPEMDIRDGFSRILQGVYQEFILHDISSSVVDDDILVFLNYKFERTLPTDWPGDQAIKHLVQKAAGLFIWAATAYRFIHEGRQFADRRLGLILQGSAIITKPEDELNKIYITVLKTSVGHGYDDQEKEILYKLLRETLGSIVLLFSPLSVDSLASLINCSGKDLRRTLDHLHSILEAPERQTCPIRLHHPSFRDFFLDTKRCTDRKLQVNGNKAHWALANSCIRIMSGKLKNDICNLDRPGALASEVGDNQKEQYIPSELQYACSYWVQHLRESKGLLLDNGEVHLFLRKNLLFWLEALSLLRKVSEGVIALISLENLVKVDQSPSLYAFIHDAKRFSLNFRSIIEQAPLQIYSSALLFAPEMCLVRKEFKSQMPKWITGVIRRQKSWSSALQTLEGHSDCVRAVVFSPDGKLVASASVDNTIRLWDSSTGAALQTLEGHSDIVEVVVFSPDGKLIASASDDKTIRLWDSNTGTALRTLERHLKRVIAVVFSPDGKLIASASYDNTVRLWDSSTGAALQTLEGHIEGVRVGVFSFGGKLIEFPPPLADKPLAFSPDGKLVAFASYGITIRLWDPSTGAVLQTLKGHSNWVSAVVFSPDSKLIASASYDNMIRLWDSSTGAALQTLEGHSNWASAVVFSPDGKLLASASLDRTVRLWDSHTGATLQTLNGNLDWVRAVAFSPDGKLVASAAHDTVKLWDSSTGAALQTLEGHLAMISAVVFSPDGKLIASASDDATIRLWEPSCGTALQTPEGHSRSVISVVFSPDGKLIVSASSDNTVRLWDSHTGAALLSLNVYINGVRAAVFSPDGKLIASASNDEIIKLWDSNTGAALQTLEGHSDRVICVVFSPDGKLIASASNDNTVRLWDSSTGVALQTLEGHSDRVIAVVFSPDGKLVASASCDKTVRLWDSNTGAALQTLEGHSGLVWTVLFSPNGKLIVSASKDNTVCFWDLSTRLLLQRVKTTFEVDTLSFSQDGSSLETNKGFLCCLPGFYNSRFPHHPAIDDICLRDRWVVGKLMGNLLWLPPGYQPICSDVRKNSIVLGHQSGYVSCIHFQ